MNDNTGPGTLWSRTLIDLLIAAVERQDASEITRLLKTIKSRGLRKREVLLAARARLSAGQFSLLERMIQGMGARRDTPPPGDAVDDG